MECPNCGNKTPSVNPCVVCGYRESHDLVLNGAVGQFRTPDPFNIDQTIYRHVVGEESKFAESYPDWQFRVLKSDDDSGWALEPGCKTTQVVVLNGEECQEKTIYPLHDGDVIELGSRRNAGVRKARMEVHIG